MGKVYFRFPQWNRREKTEFFLSLGATLILCAMTISVLVILG